jgi:hypothetical protein
MAVAVTIMEKAKIWEDQVILQLFTMLEKLTTPKVYEFLLL